MHLQRIHILTGVLVVVCVAGVGVYLQTKTEQRYQSVSVVRGDIVQEVLASGNVEAPTTVDLHFKSSGRMVALDAAVGQHVVAGTVLATQDTAVLDAQLAQAQASVSAAQAVLRTLQSGATPQAVAVSQANLATAKQGLANAYTSVGSTLADAYAKSTDAVSNQLASFFSNAQTTTPQITFLISDSQAATNMVSQRTQAGIDLAGWQQENASLDPTNPAGLDAALAHAVAHVLVVQTLLTTAVAVASGNTNLSATTAASYRAAASAGLSEVNAALSELRALQQTVASNKAAVAQAQAALDLTTTGSTQNALDAQQAQVAQAQAAVAALEAQLHDLEIVAPVAGIITTTTGSVGDVITPTTAVVSLIPDATLQVTVNVSEDNVVGVAVGDPATIELDAFPLGTTFLGTVSSIDPAQTIIGGAVYYQTTILFDKKYVGIKPGMTANVRIQTASSTNTLLIPASALTQMQSATSSAVEVLHDDTAVPRSVTLGLKSQGGMVEVLSGLSAGEQVVVGTN